MIEAIIFDCFGVLIGDGLELVCRDIEKDNPEARKYIGETIRLSNSGLIEPEESTRRIADYLNIPLENWRKMVGNGEVRDDRVAELIRSLRATYKTAMLSNIGRGSLDRRFAAEELEALFDVVVVSGDVGMVKPDHEIYKYTASMLNVLPENCVFLDDREGYCAAAREVGMQAIWYRDFVQAKAELDTLLSQQT